MKSIVIIKNWSIKDESVRNPYIAPEIAGKCLSGVVYGHIRKPDGTSVVTSIIKIVNGRLVTTESGTEYMLDGDPDPEYMKWLSEHGYEYNKDNPIKVIKE